MNEEMKNEIMKAAEILGLSEEDAMSKFEDICSKNNHELRGKQRD